MPRCVLSALWSSKGYEAKEGGEGLPSLILKSNDSSCWSHFLGVMILRLLNTSTFTLSDSYFLRINFLEGNDLER